MASVSLRMTMSLVVVLVHTLLIHCRLRSSKLLNRGILKHRMMALRILRVLRCSIIVIIYQNRLYVTMMSRLSLKHIRLEDIGSMLRVTMS